MASTPVDSSSLAASRPYYRVASERMGPFDGTSVTINQLGLLEFHLSRFGLLAGVERVLGRMRAMGYSWDNLHHDISLVESAGWFHASGSTVEFEPRVASRRMPDYKLVMSGLEIFVEVKVQELGLEAERLLPSNGNMLSVLPDWGGKVKQRLLEAVGVLNEKKAVYTDPQLPKDKPGIVLIDLRFAAGTEDDVDALSAFLGQFDSETGRRLENGLVHNERAKNVCGLLLVDQRTILERTSGMVFVRNPLNRRQDVEASLGGIGISS